MDRNIIESLRLLLGTERVLVQEDVTSRIFQVWKPNEALEALAVVLPHNTKEVSEIMKLCHDARQTVVLHGGLTNLVGSTETNGSEVVISMEKMNRILEVDVQSRTATVEAGVILENLQKRADDEGLLFPLNFGAKGSAQVGGIISTNAGGMRVFRYGMTRSLVLGLEVVLADGTILSSLKKIIKDNSGYDLKHLFIGSEGTLGIVTKAVMRLSEKPKSRIAGFAGLRSYENVVGLLRHLEAGLAGTLSVFELLWKPAFVGLTSEPSNRKPPLPYDFDYYVLFESLGSHHHRDQLLIEGLLEEALSKGLIEDCVIADTSAELDWFFGVREDVENLNTKVNNAQFFDISIPIGSIGTEVEKIVAKLEDHDLVDHAFAFGHLADGNIHLVVSKQEENSDLVQFINETVYEPLKALNGSVSAEHGIGVHKKSYLHISRTSEEIAAMKAIKKVMDPLNLLNPGKIFD